MAQKSVAVLDVRSSEVTVFVGERGVNGTFVFKASRTEPYGGYENGEFFKEGDGKISDAILRAISAVEQVCGERLRMLYVGVPGDFTKVLAKEQDIGFPKKRKITEKDRETLIEAGKEKTDGYRFMRASSMIYVTNDKQRVVDPVGISTAGLTGCISYFYCSEYFCRVIEEAVKDLRISLKYLPTQFAMASYLVPSETRDECALFLDAGNISSTVSIVLGNGIMAQHSFCAVGGKGELCFGEERTALRLNLSPALLKRLKGVLAEILGIGYKYEFLSKNLRVALSKREKKLLAAALIAADFEGDKSFILRRLPDTGEYAIDGIYAFRLAALREKWTHILSYVPSGFSSADLTQFCEFLVGESRHKIYLKDGSVFGENFTRLSRSSLMGEENAETEIILSDAGFVYCLGEVDASLCDFLQKYFAERAIFS